MDGALKDEGRDEEVSAFNREKRDSPRQLGKLLKQTCLGLEHRALEKSELWVREEERMFIL